MVDRELDELRASIDREATSIGAALAAVASERADDDPPRELAEHRELTRQLRVLRDRVPQAESELGDPRELRAELATLLSFARTLQTDAETLHEGILERARDLVRAEAAARLARERRAVELEELRRLRDALQARIAQTADGLAAGDETECRGTVPVIRLDEGLTVCSMGVASPKRRLRARQFWLVTLTETRDDVLVRRT